MELSLRRRAAGPRAVDATPASAMPRLRVWPVDRLLLHEEADAVRVRRLADALRRDGVLRNPPVVAVLDDGRAVVLDGANRVTALHMLRIPHAVVQEIEYDDPGVRLSVWRHYVPEGLPGVLRGAAAALAPDAASRVDDAAEAESQLAAGEALAAVVDAQGGVLLRRGGGVAVDAEALRALVAVYRDAPAVHRVEGGARDDLDSAYGPGALVLFRRFEKAEIVALAQDGGRLPAGVTRYVIPGRALRLNTPLPWLAGEISAAAAQAALDAQLRQRWQAHGVRYYAEPAFLFDE